MSELTAAERLDRTLAIVPWVAEQSEGTASFKEICDRFAIDADDLRDCLVITSMVGVHPYTPDLLINAIIEADTVTIELPEYFRRPLRLTAEQTFALLTSAKALLSIPGADQQSSLARGLAKVLHSMGEGSETAVDIGIATASDVITDDLRSAIALGRSVEMTYYSYGRDDTGSRIIDPWQIHSEGGLWYLQAYCRLSNAQRMFRIDRIRTITALKESFTAPDPLPDFVLFDSNDSLGTVKLRLRPSARWVIEYYPTEWFSIETDSTIIVEIAVGSLAWLERLLLRLGDEAEILQASPGLETVGRDAARRLLTVYLD